jgi:transposase
MARDYRPVLRDQAMLLPVDMRDWLPERHFVWFLLAVLAELDVSAFEVGRRRGGVGRQGYDPRLLLGLLVYGYSQGQRSSRRIEELCATDVAYRVICAQDAPDHTVIARFRQAHPAAIAKLFVQVLELAGEAGLGRVGTIAIDGTRIAANASPGANRRRSWLKKKVDEAMAEAEQVDAAEDTVFGSEESGGQVKQEWADPSSRAARIKAALARAEETAKQQSQEQERRAADWQQRVAARAEQHARERANADRKHREYQQQQAAAAAGDGPSPRGRPAPPADQAAPTRLAAEQLARAKAKRDAAAARAEAERTARDPWGNVTDPDSGSIPTSKGWIQGYNAQLAVSDDQIVLGVSVTNAPGDAEQFEPLLKVADSGVAALNRGRARAERREVQIGQVLADAGYFSAHNLTVSGPDRLIAPTSRHRFRDTTPIPDRAPTDPAVNAMRVRFRDPDTVTAYRRRGVIVEPVNGHFKDRHGLRQYACRGLTAVQAETELVAATANLLKIWRRAS